MQTKFQPTSTQQVTPLIAPIDPVAISQSESPTAIILAIAILISILVSGITGLLRVIVVTKTLK